MAEALTILSVGKGLGAGAWVPGIGTHYEKQRKTRTSSSHRHAVSKDVDLTEAESGMVFSRG